MKSTTERLVREADPNGLSQHVPGAKLDTGKLPVFSSLLVHFPRALAEVTKVAMYGEGKYSAMGWREVDQGIMRYSDALARHLMDEALGRSLDPESGLRHAAHVAWNALARLELLMLSVVDDSTRSR